MHVDYIIVGLGLAGLAFARELEANNKSFLVFEDKTQQSSLVAAGAYNPVVLKRFNAVWNAEYQLELALPFYKKIENQFNKKYDTRIDIYRIFTSVEEQNNWFVASDKPILSRYMHPKVIQNTNKQIKAPFGFGKLTGTGIINTRELINDYRAYLLSKKQLVNHSFDYSKLQFKNHHVTYDNIVTKQVVFCEGFGLRKNPYFKDLPMEEAKGELLTIHAPNLKLDVILKSAIFLQPIGDDFYKIGATFNWDDKTSIPTESAKKELIKKIESFIETKYTIEDHVAGIRPTVKDRRPLLGVHNKYKQLAILNGLGTRGVMLAPTMAKELYQHLEFNKELAKEITIDRFFDVQK